MKKLIRLLELVFGRGSSSVIGSKVIRRGEYTATYLRGASYVL